MTVWEAKASFNTSRSIPHFRYQFSISHSNANPVTFTSIATNTYYYYYSTVTIITAQLQLLLPIARRRYYYQNHHDLDKIYTNHNFLL